MIPSANESAIVRDQALDALRRGRAETLGLVEGLSQLQMDAVPEPDRWSVGEILDHLVRADELFTKEIRILAKKNCRTGKPFVFRSLRDIGALFGWLPLPFRLPLEAGLVGFNLTVPPVAREWLLGQRRLPGIATGDLRPRKGRRGQSLRADLEFGVAEVERLVGETNFEGIVYYSPIAGFNGVDGLVRLISSHERRHQEQLREVLAALPIDEGPEPSNSTGEDR